MAEAEELKPLMQAMVVDVGDAHLQPLKRPKPRAEGPGPPRPLVPHAVKHKQQPTHVMRAVNSQRDPMMRPVLMMGAVHRVRVATEVDGKRGLQNAGCHHSNSVEPGSVRYDGQ
ncbi:hypothetical protein I7I51_02030 [Histoplasma capsulatum]|uniref:Uncharacterized protein n=1 Tax=Ajellomyces capsulatus TaxID=5037 RepID=A0A8A1MK06_AJECA|nr:hypothetical protein I7I51_02030 [Histoplasma capsulatum]